MTDQQKAKILSKVAEYLKDIENSQILIQMIDNGKGVEVFSESYAGTINYTVQSQIIPISVKPT